MQHPAPDNSQVQVTLQAGLTVDATVMSTSQDVNSAWRYSLQFQQTDGNNVDTVDLVNVHQVYVILPEDEKE